MHHRHCGPRRQRRRSGRHRSGQGFGWWAGGGRFFGTGEVRLALLALLAERPRHGYELMKELGDRSGGTYRPSAGTIYPTLQQLEDEGLVRSESSDGKRVYHLTDAGRREVEAEEATIRRIWRRADEWGEWSHAAAPETWEIARPAMELAKAAMRAVSRGGGDRERVEEVREILQDATRELEELAERG